MNKILFFIFFIVSFCPLNAFCADYPSIEVTPSEIQLGVVTKMEDIRGSFIIRNNGVSTLKIIKIRPSCDCLLIPSYPPEIPVGGEAEIEFVLEPKTLRGVFTKYIYIQSSDVKRPLTRISVSGEAKRVKGTGAKDIELFLFYSSGCRHCRKVRDIIIPGLVKRYPRLDIKVYDITDADNFTRLIDFEERFGVKETAPVVVFVGERYFAGYRTIKDELEGYVSFLFSGGREYLPRREARWAEKFSIFTIVTAGLLDGLNPCAFVTIVFLVSLLTVMEKKKHQILGAGLIFSGAVFISYLLIGFGVFHALYRLRIFGLFSSWVYYLSVIMVFTLGLFSLYDFTVYALTRSSREIKLQLPSRIKIKIHEIMKENFGRRGIYLASGIAGFWVSILEGICTGQVYFPIIALMNKGAMTQTQGLVMLIIYNFMFVLPLILVCAAAFLGVSYYRIHVFSRKNVLISKLLLTLLFLCIGVLLLQLP